MFNSEQISLSLSVCFCKFLQHFRADMHMEILLYLHCLVSLFLIIIVFLLFYAFILSHQPKFWKYLVDSPKLYQLDYHCRYSVIAVFIKKIKNTHTVQAGKFCEHLFFSISVVLIKWQNSQLS